MGRPRKAILPTEDDDIVTVVPMKRPRGRPRKVEIEVGDRIGEAGETEGATASGARPPQVSTIEITKEPMRLRALLSEKPPTQDFSFWIIGLTPLICHAWSEKAKKEMLGKQAGATRSAKEKRNPKQDFLDSLYDMGKGNYGFPVTAVKKAIWSCAHKDRGIPRSDVQVGLWLDAEVVSARPALAGARCDMPLVRIYGSKPEMREDMVRIGAGPRKTANRDH